MATVIRGCHSAAALCVFTYFVCLLDSGQIMVLGSCIFEDVNRQLRWRSCHPKADMQGNGKADEAQGLVFFGVSNGESAAALLRRCKAEAA